MSIKHRSSAYVFIISLVVVSLLSLSSGSLFMLWLLMEVGVVLFMGLIASEAKPSAEVGAKFFLSQAFVGAALFLVFQARGWEVCRVGDAIFLVCLLMKMGIAPFHFWVPNVVSKLSWESLFILLSLQKLPPMLMLGWSVSLNPYLVKFMAFTAVVSGVFGQGYKDFNSVITFTSMVTSVWLLVVSSLDPSLMVYGFLCYSALLFFTLGTLKKGPEKIHASSAGVWGLVMLAGSPGGPVFSIKWLVFSSLMQFGHLGEALILAISVITAAPLYVSLITNILLARKPWWYHEGVSWFWVLGLVVLSVSFWWLPVVVY